MWDSIVPRFLCMLTTLLRRRFLGAGAIFASSSRQMIFAGTYNTPACENQFPPLQTHFSKNRGIFRDRWEVDPSLKIVFCYSSPTHFIEMSYTLIHSKKIRMFLQIIFIIIRCADRWSEKKLKTYTKIFKLMYICIAGFYIYTWLSQTLKRRVWSQWQLLGSNRYASTELSALWVYDCFFFSNADSSVSWTNRKKGPGL